MTLTKELQGTGYLYVVDCASKVMKTEEDLLISAFHLLSLLLLEKVLKCYCDQI